MKGLLAALWGYWRYPRADDTAGVAALTSAQWQGISRRTSTYLEGYRDRPGSDDRAQRRARHVAGLPEFQGAGSVLEIGCGAGRNLAELRRRYPALRLHGLDINREAVEAARRAVPDANVKVGDLHHPRLPLVDVVLSVGVLVHLHPDLAGHLLGLLALVADRSIVLVEQDTLGQDKVVKGPTAWGAEQETGAYVMWSPNILCRVPKGWGLIRSPLPPDLVAPGATHIVTLTKAQVSS